MQPDPIALTAAHLRDAKLYADRFDLVRGLSPKVGGRFAEVGVALGGFSTFLIDEFKPAEFHAFDTFDMHHFPEHWGRSSQDIFGQEDHETFYRGLLHDSPAEIHVHVGLSQDTLARYKGAQFDLIYIDAAHHYEGVKTDADLSATLLSPGGAIIFNDYTLYDPMIRAPYGVVPAVNEIVATGDWVVVGLGLQRHMFCDIAIKRR